ncbi:MAG: GMC family oxidoreductase [Acidobacteriaceae bacterium]|nr:GMC family oxidoreductase [Acidobacteriaceae bacterium]
MKRLKSVDIVIVGGGWSGLLMAKELVSRTTLEVVVLERGPARVTADYAAGMDEVDYTIRNRLMQNPAEQTVTHRHSIKDRAAPIRQYGSFKPGTGTGGTGEHWGGISDRYLPDFFALGTHLREKHGARALSADLTVHDWGVTYGDLENDYWRAEQLLGVSGKAGNLRGRLVEGGNIFEGPRQQEYPTPPLKPNYGMTLFGKAARELGYHPFPLPAANLSEVYTNPDGVSRPGCVYCGYCPAFGCMIGAKAQPTNTLLPVLQHKKSFQLRNHCWARRVVHREGRAEGILYMDESGHETLQSAAIVILAALTPHNTRLLLLSGIGEPYDPLTGRGTLGKNLTHQVTADGGALVVHTEPLNSFMTSGALGYNFADFDGDRAIDLKWGILRGGTFGRGTSPGELPITSFGHIPLEKGQRNWGAEWKKTSIQLWDRISTGNGFRGDHLAYRQNFMDLDPTYTDRWGDPLLRMTLDWTPHEHRQMAFGKAISSQLAQEIARITKAKLILPHNSGETSTPALETAHPPKLPRYSAASYSTTHIQGGAIMGQSPENSVVNTFLQHWQMPNLWVIGSSSFPQNSSGNPTLTILAVTYRAADALVNQYLKRPGMLS